METPWKQARVLVASAAIVATAACGGGSSSEPEPGGGEPVAGGELQFALPVDHGCLDYRQTSQRALLQIGRQITDSLVYLDADGEAHPWLATSWEINDDATEYVFHLRDDVTFTDGTPFTAETVKANIDSLHELGGVVHVPAAFLETYAGTEVVDEHTVSVTFEEPNAPFLYGISTPNFGMYSDDTTVLDEDALCGGDFVTTGPYTVEEYSQNERVVLTRNEDYDWGPESLDNTGPGHAETIIVNTITDSFVMASNAENGGVDLVLDIAANDVERLRDAGWDNNPQPDPALSASWVIRQGNGIAGTDPAVREAIVRGVDREALMSVAGPLQAPATGVLNESHPFYSDQSGELGYAPDEAAQILESAGWVEGADGIREKDGERLVVDTIFYVENALPIMELAKEQLAQIGIELELNQITSNEATARRVEGNFEMRLDWFTGPEPTVIANTVAYLEAPEDVMDLVAQQEATIDPDERREIVAELSDLVLGEGLIIPLYTQNTTPFHGPSVTGRVSDIAGLLMLTQMQRLE